ncbi:MAG: porin family protein [Alphaproteobacteria bacterium]|nr:porin family protein [Alphaproteobacteria bacterium]
MRKFLLLAGIFTFFAYSQAKAEQYYENDGYYYQDEPRYVERVEYREPVRQGYRKAGYEYQEPQYKRIKKEERVVQNQNNYGQQKYYEKTNNISPYIGLDIAINSTYFGESEWIKDNQEGGYEYFEDKNTTLNFIVGAKFNKHFSLEVFYQTSSEEDMKVMDYEDWKTTISYTAFGIDSVGYMPISQELELLASLGLAQYYFESDDKYYEDWGGGYGEWINTSKDFDTLGFRFGIGAQYNITNNLALRGMARYIKMNDDEYVKSLTEFSLGLRYMF